MLVAADQDLEKVVLNLDFQKAFDMISAESIIAALELFGFSQYITSWTRLLYRNFKARVQNNGHLSEYFNVERSVHQGAPNSCYYFIIVVELLAEVLRKNGKIHGINVREIEYLLNQYADDMNSTLDANDGSIEEFLSKLAWFEQLCGLKVNYDKTAIYRIGSLANSDAMRYTAKKVNWTNEGITVLGIDVRYSEQSTMEVNFEKVLLKAKNVLNQWSRRWLSLEGKVNIINTMVASLLIYKTSVLINLSEQMLKRIEQIMEKFIWNGGRPKIPLRILQKDKSEGGLKLVDLRLREAAMKIVWVDVVSKENDIANLSYYFLQPVLREVIWSCNLKNEDVPRVVKRKTSVFWINVLEAWSQINYSESLVDHQPIWWNSLIKVGGIPVFWEKEFNHGLIFVHQLRLSDGGFVSSQEAASKFHMTPLHYNSIITAINSVLKDGAKLERSGEPLVYSFVYEENIARKAYARLLDRKCVPDNIAERWSSDLRCEITDSFLSEIFLTTRKLTTIGKYRSFQYRLLRRAIVLNTHLERWKKRETDECSQCEIHPETAKHLFYECGETKNLWTEILPFIQGFDSEKVITWNLNNVLFNQIVPDKFHVINFLCLVFKQYIYRQRCLKQSLSAFSFINIVNEVRNSEKYYAKINNKMLRHSKKWSPNTIYKAHNVDTDIDHYVIDYINAA